MKSTLIVAVVVMFCLGSCTNINDHTSLLGAWNCHEIPEQTVQRNYQVNIVRNYNLPESTNQYIINNFYQMGFGEESEVRFYQDEDSGELIIESQLVNGYSIHGSGSVTDNFSEITWVYYVNSGVVNEKVNATYY